MIDNAQLKDILANANDFSLVAEFYSVNAVPTSEGFDPNNAIGKFAAVDGITFRGVDYLQLVKSFGRITKTINESVGTASVTFSNVSRTIAQFEFGNGFEGLIMVIRLLSRNSSVELNETQILFVGRCDRPLTGNKDSLTVTAKYILGSLDVRIPRRNYGPEDFKGRVPSDPEFEGFPHMVQYGTTTYNRIEHRGGFLGLWNNKEVRATLQWSTYSDAEASKMVAECFGRVQLKGVTTAAADVGPQIRMQKAFCEGPIQDFVNVRSADPTLPLNTSSYWETYGLVGTANQLDPTNPGWLTWPGELNYYSRTARIACQADNASMEETEPAPDVIAVIEAKIITTPDANGVWNTEAWTDNPAAVVRHILTSPDYYNLDPNWLDDEFFTAFWNYNKEEIFNTRLNDFVFAES